MWRWNSDYFVHLSMCFLRAHGKRTNPAVPVETIGGSVEQQFNKRRQTFDFYLCRMCENINPVFHNDNNDFLLRLFSHPEFFPNVSHPKLCNFRIEESNECLSNYRRKMYSTFLEFSSKTISSVGLRLPAVSTGWCPVIVKDPEYHLQL